MKLLSYYKTIKQLHAQAYRDLENMKKLAPSHATTKAVADAALISRKCGELLEDIRKQFQQLQDILGNIGCMMLVAKGTGEPLHGDYAKAYGKVSQAAKVPSYSKEPEAYAALCEALGVECSPLTRIHFPALKELISSTLEAGGNVPEAIKPYLAYADNKLVASEKEAGLLDEAAAKAQGII